MANMNVEIPFLSRSLAYARFKEQHTLCNDYYWHNILTRTMACKFSIGISETDNPHILCKRNPHFPNNFKEWKDRILDSENWLRLNVLLVSNSYFEQYFFEIINTLLSSRPSLLLGDNKTINGVYYLKNNIVPKSITNFCEDITRGPWCKRRQSLEDIVSAECFSDKDVNWLDKIRMIRNKVAHRFGHDFVESINCFFTPNPQERLSEERLLGYLRFIEEKAEQIDRMLYPLIGNYELLLLWHIHKNDYNNFINPIKNLKKIINSYNIDSSISTGQAKKLLEYYNSF